jgi:hypothetical protein
MVNFKPGMVQFVFTPEGGGAESKQAVVILPSDFFLDTFGDPHKMDKGLHEQAMRVIEEWDEVNGGDDMKGQRTNVEACFVMGRHEWRSGFLWHFSEYELQINSWGFTAAHNKDFNPPTPQLEDLKVFPPPCVDVCVCVTGGLGWRAEKCVKKMTTFFFFL